MAKTITIDSAQLNEIRVRLSPTGQVSVQASFALLSGKQVFKEVSLVDLTGRMQQGELAAASALVTAINGVLERVELS